MYVFGSGRCGWRGGELMRELGLGFTNPVGTVGVWDMCLGRERWGRVMSV